jgi:hypothetical protein
MAAVTTQFVKSPVVKETTRLGVCTEWRKKMAIVW